MVGKITVGYQGWFAARGDTSPINGWWHWSDNWGEPPSPANHALQSWPDMTDYANEYPTAFGALGNGQPATVFSNYDYQTVDVHFRWMREYGCDTAALQRFNPTGGEGQGCEHEHRQTAPHRGGSKRARTRPPIVVASLAIATSSRLPTAFRR